MSRHENLSSAVKIHRQHGRMRSSSASQKTYRLVHIVFVYSVALYAALVHVKPWLQM